MSGLARRRVLRAHVVPLIRLEVHGDQDGLVAPVAMTLAQVAPEPGAHVWGLWRGEEPVGLMAMVDPREGCLEEGDDPEAAFLWRLMIGRDHRAAAQARGWGLPRLATSAVERADSALPFRERHGYRRTGRVVDGEVELVRDPTRP